MAYISKAAEVFIGSFNVDPNDFDCQTDGAGGVIVTAWRSGVTQPTEQQVVDAFNATPTAFATTMAAKRLATVGRVLAVRKSANQSRSAQTPADVTDLVFTLLPNTHYIFEFEGAYTADAATTGLRVGVNGPASPVVFRAVQEVHMSATSRLSSAVGAYDTPVLGTGSGGSTAFPFRVKGNITTNAAGGPLALRFASEVAASNVTILAGSWGELKVVE